MEHTQKHLNDRHVMAMFGGLVASFALVVAVVSHFQHDDNMTPSSSAGVVVGMNYAHLADVAASK